MKENRMSTLFSTVCGFFILEAGLTGANGAANLNAASSLAAQSDGTSGLGNWPVMMRVDGSLFLLDAVVLFALAILCLALPKAKMKTICFTWLWLAGFAIGLVLNIVSLALSFANGTLFYFYLGMDFLGVVMLSLSFFRTSRSEEWKILLLIPLALSGIGALTSMIYNIANFCQLLSSTTPQSGISLAYSLFSSLVSLALVVLSIFEVIKEQPLTDAPQKVADENHF